LAITDNNWRRLKQAQKRRVGRVGRLLDNESHDSTGGQRTVSGVVRFAELCRKR
jgi:hypothetical protein